MCIGHVQWEICLREAWKEKNKVEYCIFQKKVVPLSRNMGYWGIAHKDENS